MNEEQIRQIIQDEIRKADTRFGIGVVPRHYHNRIDSPPLPPQSLTNTKPFLQTATNILAPVVVYPIPVVTGAPPTAAGPEGTIVITNNLGTYKLYGYANGVWRDLTGL